VSLDKQIEHIRKTHASAQPRRENISWWNTHNDLTVALNRIAELEAQLEAARKDGERYRWLLANLDDPEGLECPIGWLLFETDSNGWNDAIDAAIEASKKDGV